MPQFIDWILSHFFIIFIILGALFSVFGKKNAKPNSGGEPFGGRASSRQNPAPRQIQASDQQEQRRSPFAGAPAKTRTGSGKKPALSPERSNVGQALTGMNAEIERRLKEQRSMQHRSRSVENATKEIERAAAGSEFKGKPSSRQKAAAGSDSSRILAASSAEDLRKGVMWAEILGAPRARKPHSSGRR